jgi:hypothetical protein
MVPCGYLHTYSNVNYACICLAMGKVPLIAVMVPLGKRLCIHAHKRLFDTFNTFMGKSAHGTFSLVVAACMASIPLLNAGTQYLVEKKGLHSLGREAKREVSYKVALGLQCWCPENGGKFGYPKHNRFALSSADKTSKHTA